MQKHHSKQLPEYFADNIMPEKKSAEIHNHNLKSSTKKFCSYKLCSMDNNFHFQKNCVKIWNSVNIETKYKFLNTQINQIKIH